MLCDGIGMLLRLWDLCFAHKQCYKMRHCFSVSSVWAVVNISTCLINEEDKRQTSTNTVESLEAIWVENPHFSGLECEIQCVVLNIVWQEVADWLYTELRSHLMLTAVAHPTKHLKHDQWHKTRAYIVTWCRVIGKCLLQQEIIINYN